MILADLHRWLCEQRTKGIEPREIRVDHEDYVLLRMALEDCSLTGTPDREPIREMFFEGIRVIEDEP